MHPGASQYRLWKNHLGEVSEPGLEDFVLDALWTGGYDSAFLNIIIQQHRKVAYLVSH